MKYEIRHRSYRPTIGGKSVPEGSMINDLGDHAVYYIGSFSEFNPIGLIDDIAVYVRKETTTSINQQKPFKLIGFELEGGLNYHGDTFNNNEAIEFSKEDLLRIANAMDDTDTLQIAVVDSIDEYSFEKDIKKVTGI